MFIDLSLGKPKKNVQKCNGSGTSGGTFFLRLPLRALHKQAIERIESIMILSVFYLCALQLFSCFDMNYGNGKAYKWKHKHV